MKISATTIFTTLAALATTTVSASSSSSSYRSECHLDKYTFTIDTKLKFDVDKKDLTGSNCDIDVYFCDKDYKECVQKYYDGVSYGGFNHIDICTNIDIEVVALSTHCRDAVVIDYAFLSKDHKKIYQWGNNNDDDAWCLSTDDDDHKDEQYKHIIETDECHDEFYFDIHEEHPQVGKDFW